MSLKLPPDLEKKIRNEVDSGKYTNMTDAIVEILRTHFQDTRLDTIIDTLDELKAELEIVKDRCDKLEKNDSLKKKKSRLEQP